MEQGESLQTSLAFSRSLTPTPVRQFLNTKRQETLSPLETTNKIVVFGGGSFGTALGAALANQKDTMEVVLLLRDVGLCEDINLRRRNTRYLPDYELPSNIRATTDAKEAILGAQFAVHAVPVQSTRAFLISIKDLLPSSVPIISVSKGLEMGSGHTMSELIPSALDRRQPCVFLSGPSFAREVVEGKPTSLVAACRDENLARTVQELFASPIMRVNTSGDVMGVEICGALKNVLAIAAGIVEGLDLGNNAMAGLIAQGCKEIRWLCEKLGAKPTTVSGLAGLGDIMLTCYGSLSRNRAVGIRLGRGEKIGDILASSKQVAEGVATAGVVVSLARKYRVSLPVLTAVAQVLDSNLTPSEAVNAIMNLPQIEEH
jgi:glycerol-3-phosphate dehydrogenase (NAD+)